MKHIHSVTDTDAFFVIDPVSRAVKNASSGKRTIIQFDHNYVASDYTVSFDIDGKLRECYTVVFDGTFHMVDENEIYAAFGRKEKNGRKIIVEESRPKEKTGKGKKRGGVGRRKK